MSTNQTSAHVGPGTYLEKDKKDFNSMFRPKIQNQNLQFGLDGRFKYAKETDATPGPGDYNDQNKWNQRTYNLKFLNLQANALQS